MRCCTVRTGQISDAVLCCGAVRKGKTLYQGDKLMEREYDFIINPKARSGMGAMVWNMLEPELKKRRIPHTVYMTERRRHAEKIAAQITADEKEHTIVVLGGDGTVNEVVNGIYDPGKVILGYIPIGSSNDFARGLGITNDAREALKSVLNPEKTVQMDVGVITFGNCRTRRFAVSAGMGFDAAVCHEVCVSKWKVFLNKIGLGKLSYAVVALDRLKKDRPVRMTVTLSDGSRKVFEKTYFAAFMNLRFEGGGFKFCPEASPEDGLLDVIVVHDITPLKILFLLPTAFLGLHVKFRKQVDIIRCSACTVETTGAIPLHMDGEPGFPRRKAEVGIMKEKLRVIIGG